MYTAVIRVILASDQCYTMDAIVHSNKQQKNIRRSLSKTALHIPASILNIPIQLQLAIL